MVVRMRSTRSHTGNRRSHHALKGTRLTKGATVVHPRHRALLDGSQYRGRSVMNTSLKRVTRKQNAAKRAEKETGAPAEKKQEEKAQ